MHALRRLAAVALLLAPVPACAQSAAEAAAVTRLESRSAAHPYARHVADAARRFGIPEAWIWDVMRVESGGNPNAVSRVGAMGVMQLMPATWAALRSQLKLGNDPFDLRDNILAGTAYLRAMHDRYGNRAAMLAAYNAGPGRYDQYLSHGRPLPVETRAYLTKLAATISRTTVGQLAPAGLAGPLGWRSGGLFVRTGTVAPGTAPGALAHSNVDKTAAVEPPANVELKRAQSASENGSRSQADSLFARRPDADPRQ